jgi:hypothetical protein
VNGVDIAAETLLFALGTIALLAAFVLAFLVWAMVHVGKRADEYEPDEHYWMRRK